MITQTELHDLFTYKDGKLYWKVKKAVRTKVGDEAGWKHHSGYTDVSINGKTHRLHRLIFLYHHGFLPKYVDHRDRDRTNNRIENLRAVTNSQNRVNSDKTWTKSGLRGVKESKNGRFEARITRLGKTYQIGTFDSAEEAHRAYLDAREALYPGVHVQSSPS